MITLFLSNSYQRFVDWCDWFREERSSAPTPMVNLKKRGWDN